MPFDGDTVDDKASLVLNHLCVRAPEKALLEDFSLTVPPGQAVGVVGPSGCGKSTLLRAIAGLIDGGGGEVLLGGEDRATVGWPEFRRRVSYLSQVPTLIEGTVEENLRRPFAYRSGQGRFERQRAVARLAAVGLEAGILTAESRSLSIGEQQRVCLVRALLTDPRFLLLDEPTSALDEENAGRVEALLLEETGRSGLGVLLVTHDREQALRVCGTVVDLEDFKPSGEAAR